MKCHCPDTTYNTMENMDEKKGMMQFRVLQKNVHLLYLMDTENFSHYVLHLFTSKFACKFVVCVFLKIILNA